MVFPNVDISAGQAPVSAIQDVSVGDYSHDMQSVLEQVLDPNRFGVRIVVAADRVPFRPPCRGVHVCESPDPTPWLQGGELILTTGIGLAGSAELQRTFVERIAARECVALGYSPHDGGVPPAPMVEVAERLGLPLFTIPYDVPLIDITMFVTKSILDAHYSSLRTAIKLHRRMLSAVTNNLGIAAILAAAGREMPAHGLVVLDYFGNVLVEYDPHGYLVGIGLEELKESGERAMANGGRFDHADSHRVTHTSCLWLDGEVQAFLIAAGHRAIDEHEELFLEQAIAGVTMTLAREHSLRQVRRVLVGELIEGIATNQVSQQVLAERMRKVAIDGTRGFQMLCVMTRALPRRADLCRLIEEELSAERPAVGIFEDLVYVVMGAEKEDAAERVYAAMRQRGWQAVIGRSRRHRGPAGLRAAYSECHTAARRAPGGEGVYDVEDLDVVSLLGGSQGELADMIISRVLGPLIEYDRAEGSRLVETLDAFLRHGCKPGPAAAQLFIHRHTLGYRLDRIAAITGRDPRNGPDLLDFAIALELYRRAALPTGPQRAGEPG